MRITREQIIDDSNLTGHIVLHGLARAHSTVLETISKDGHADVVMTVNGVEVDLADFVDHWQQQIRGVLMDKARRLVADRVRVATEAVEELGRRAQLALDSLPEEML